MEAQKEVREFGGLGEVCCEIVEEGLGDAVGGEGGIEVGEGGGGVAGYCGFSLGFRREVGFSKGWC